MRKKPEISLFELRVTGPAFKVALAKLDPQKQFTRSEPWLIYRLPLPRTDVERWRVGLWQVLNERDFPNNQIEIPMPEACRATPR